MEKARAKNRHEQIPQRVTRARIEGDVAYLQGAGRKGGEATALKNKRAKDEDEVLATYNAEQELARKEEANEHIIPLDTYN